MLEFAALEWVSRCVWESRNFFQFPASEEYTGNVGQLITLRTGSVDVETVIGVRQKSTKQ